MASFAECMCGFSSEITAVDSENVITVINRTETMFDIVFVRCVSQEYYMRLLPEIYNETMNPAIDELVCELANNLKNETSDKISLNAIGLFGENLYVTGIDLDKKIYWCPIKIRMDITMFLNR